MRKFLIAALLCMLAAAFAACAAGSHTLTFEVSGGSAVPAQSVGADAVTERPEDPVREGYLFRGWYADEGFTELFVFGEALTEDVTVYAKWAESVTLTFDSDGGSAVPAQVIEKGSVPQKPDDPVKDGSLFGFWADAEGNAFDFTAALGENASVKAVWINAFTVTFDTEGLTAIPRQTVKKGEKATDPDVPLSKPNHEFVCWVDEAGEPYDFDAPVTGDIVLKPEWVKYFSVTYRWADGNGTPIATKRVYEGGKAEDWGAYNQAKWATVALYWYTSEKENPLVNETVNELSERYDFSEVLTEDLDLFTYQQERVSWKLPADATYDETNPWSIESAGQAAEGEISYGTDHLRFTVRQGASHINQLQMNQMLLPFDVQTMRYLKFTYRNLSESDAYVRAFIYGMKPGANAVEQLYANNIAGLRTGMSESDGFETFVVDLNGMEGTIIFVRLEFISAVSDPHDANGTDIMLGSVAFTNDLSGAARHAVSFDSAGGSAVAGQSVLHGYPAGKPDDPVKEGSIFGGWLDEDGNPYLFTEPVTADLTLTASWVDHFTVNYRYADGNGTLIESRSVPADGGYAVYVRLPEVVYATQANYWYLSERSAPTVAELSGRYDFGAEVTGNLDLYSYLEDRVSWELPADAQYDAANPWKAETAGAPFEGSIAYGADHLRFTVPAGSAHINQLEMNQMALTFDPARMRYLTVTYKNLSATDGTLRLFVYGDQGSGIIQLHAFNYAGLQTGMKETDAFASFTMDLGNLSGKVVFIRMEFVSDASAPCDNNGTDILLGSVLLTGTAPAAALSAASAQRWAQTPVFCEKFLNKE